MNLKEHITVCWIIMAQRNLLEPTCKGLHLVHFPFHYIGNRKGSCTEEHVLLPVQIGMGFHTCFQSKLKTTRGIYPPFSTFFKVNFLNLFMALLGIHCCTVFSLVAVNGATLLQCSGLSLWWPS